MADPLIKKLLALQKCDARCDSIKQQLQRIPQEVEEFKRKIEEEKTAIDTSRQALREVEVEGKKLDHEIGTAEEQLVKYKTQQLMVKKNDAYQALQHEIDTLTARVSDLEDQEIKLLLEVDQMTEKVRQEESERNRNIKQLQNYITRRLEHEAAFKKELDAAEKAVALASSATEPKSLQTYLYIKKMVKRSPFVVPIKDHKCTGCHLRVSADVEAMTHKKDELSQCHSCGRIVYYAG